MTFTTHKIQSETLGDFLIKTRQARGWELSDIEKRIGISEKYLRDLEENAYHRLPSPTYTRGFLEHYAQFLNLDSSEIVKRYRQENKFFEDREKVIFKKKGITQRMLPGFKKKMSKTINLRRLIVFFIIGLVVGYFIFLIKVALFPPRLTITQPENNFFTQEKTIKLIGQTEKEAVIKINDQSVSKIVDGFFEETIDLSPGVNMIKVSAKKKYSPETVVWRKIIVQEQP